MPSGFLFRIHSVILMLVSALFGLFVTDLSGGHDALLGQGGNGPKGATASQTGARQGEYSKELNNFHLAVCNDFFTILLC